MFGPTFETIQIPQIGKDFRIKMYNSAVECGNRHFVIGVDNSFRY